MKDHLLIKLLKSFSKKEIKEFDEFITVAYFNKRKAVKKLYETIKKYYPDFNNTGLENQNIFDKLFPGKKYNESSLRVLLHYLYELAKKFIAIKSFESNELEYEFSIQSELFKRNQIHNMDKTIDKNLAGLDPKKHISEQFFFHKSRLEFEKLFYLTVSLSGVFEKKLDKFDFQKIFDGLTIYYYLKAMKFYIIILNLEIIYKKEFKKDHFEKLISEMNISDFDGISVIKIYYYLIKILTAKDSEKFYFKAKEILLQTEDTIYIADISEIHINMKNYCKRKIAEGIEYYKKEEFEITIQEINSKSYLINGEMPPLFYRNTVNTALRINNFAWVKNFIYEFKNELPGKNKNDAFNYCLALYEFKTGNYGKSLELISKIKYEETYQKVESKILQMMIYFETSAVESLYSSVEAFRQFLSNDKVMPENRKIPYINFYKTLAKLSSLNNKKDKYELMKFKTNLLTQMKVSNKDWLLEKTDNSLTSLQSKKIRKMA